MGKGRFDLLPCRAVAELARLYEAGCLKYGDRNWEKGIPLSVYLDSALRHSFKHLAGWRDERHDLAAAWNWMCLIETKMRIDEGRLPKRLNDLPAELVITPARPRKKAGRASERTQKTKPARKAIKKARRAA